jgi:hypothetical protein
MTPLIYAINDRDPKARKVHQRIDRLLNQDRIPRVHECLYSLDIANSAGQTLKVRQPAPVSRKGKQTRLVNRVLRPRSDADPPPFLERPPPMLLLLEIRQPLDHRRDPARS